MGGGSEVRFWRRSASPETEPDDFEVEPGFVSLFNGKDLSGWGFREHEVVAADRDFHGKTASDDGRYVARNGRTDREDARRKVGVSAAMDHRASSQETSS